MSNVNWREVSEKLADAIGFPGNSAERAALLAYRLACELDGSEPDYIPPRAGQGISDNPYVNDPDCNDPKSRAMRWHNELMPMYSNQAVSAEPFNGLTAEPRVGDRVRVVTDDSRPPKGGVGTIVGYTPLKDIQWTVSFHWARYSLSRHEFEILPRDGSEGRV